jgi:hypothetical protein
MTTTRGRLALAVVLGAAIVCVGPLVRGSQEAASGIRLPTGRDVVDRHVAAMGGAEAIARHTSRHSTGTFEMRQQGIAGTMEVFAARPAKELARIDLPGFGVTEAGFDGEVGWSIDPAVGPRLLQGKELERLRLLAEFDAALHAPEQYASLETVARTAFDGRDCLKVRVTSRSGIQWMEYYDASTGLLAGMEGEQDTPMGPVTVTTTMREYRRFDGLLLPTVSVQRVAGTGQEITMTLREVRFDEVDESTFARPPSIRTLLDAK